MFHFLVPPCIIVFLPLKWSLSWTMWSIGWSWSPAHTVRPWLMHCVVCLLFPHLSLTHFAYPRVDGQAELKQAERLIAYWLLSSLSLFHWPQNVTLDDLESPFCIKFCFAPVCLELWSLAFESWLFLVWMLSVNFKPTRTAAVSCGFLVTAQLSCWCVLQKWVGTEATGNTRSILCLISFLFTRNASPCHIPTQRSHLVLLWLVTHFCGFVVQICSL